MKKLSFSIAVLIFSAFLCWADQKAATPENKPATLQDKLSYCYGAQVGDALKGSEIDLKIFESALTAAMTGAQADLSADQLAAILTASAKAKRENKDLVYQGYAREKLDTAAKELSYAQGHRMGSKLKEEGISVSAPIFMSAIKAKLTGQEMLMTGEEQVKAMNENAVALRAAAKK